MHRVYRQLALALMCVLGVGVSPCAAKADTVTDSVRGSLVFVAPDSAPFYFLDERQRLTGTITELFGKIAENAGYDWRGEIYPTRRALNVLAKGEGDVMVVVRNPILDRANTVVVSPRPITYGVLNVYHRHERSRIETKEDLTGKKVGVIAGYGYGGLRSWLDDPVNRIDLSEAFSVPSSLRMLDRNRVDYLLLYAVNFNEAQRRIGSRLTGITVDTLSRLPVYIQMHEAVPNVHDVMADLMASFDDLVARGEVTATENGDAR